MWREAMPVILAGLALTVVYGLGRRWRQRRVALAIGSSSWSDADLDKLAEILNSPDEHEEAGIG